MDRCGKGAAGFGKPRFWREVLVQIQMCIIREPRES